MTNDDHRSPPRSQRKIGQEHTTKNVSRINILAPVSRRERTTPQQPTLDLGIERERDVSGIGMGVLSDGTPYLNQRGLAALCGLHHGQIGALSVQWGEVEEKPRVKRIKSILSEAGDVPASSHIVVEHKGIAHHCYPAEICLAVLEYYALDAGNNCRPEALKNFRKLAGSKLRDLIYSKVGYDPTGQNQHKFQKWHERISLNYKQAPRGFFHVFNESETIIYELIEAGADIGEKFVVDISIGQHWSKHWVDAGLDAQFGERRRYPHRYPPSHPQALSNPQDSWCYPLAALGAFREWMRDAYVEGGKFKSYLDGKVRRGDLPPSIAELAIAAVETPQIGHDA